MTNLNNQYINEVSMFCTKKRGCLKRLKFYHESIIYIEFGKTHFSKHYKIDSKNSNIYRHPLYFIRVKGLTKITIASSANFFAGASFLYHNTTAVKFFVIKIVNG